jgi:hypothetical protein
MVGFFETLAGIMALDLDAIRGIQAAPNGLRQAVTIILLGCASDAVGNSPLLFVDRIRFGRVVVCLLVETALAAVRVAIWGVCLALVISVLEGRFIPPSRVLLVIGIGYAPMVLGALAIIPTLGAFIAMGLHLWALLAIAASIVAAGDIALRTAISTALLAWLALVVLSRIYDPLVISLLGQLSKRFLGVDVMQRSRHMDLLGRTLVRFGGVKRGGPR